MKETTLLAIASRINEVAKPDGVYAKVDFSPWASERTPEPMKVWDIELSYNGYHLVERFNSTLPIEDFEADRIAQILLKDLFSDYFAAKLGQKRREYLKHLSRIT